MILDYKGKIWFLVTLVWAALSLGLWHLAPYLPRATMTIPENSQLLGFGPDGKFALILTHKQVPDSPTETSTVSADVVEVPTARFRKSVSDPTAKVVQLVGVSRDGRIFLIRELTAVGPCLTRLDLHDLSSTRLAVDLTTHTHAWPNDKLLSGDADCLSPDGSLCAVHCTATHTLEIWNLHTNQQQVTFPNSTAACRFSSNSRSIMIVEDHADHALLKHCDVESGAIRSTLSGPTGRKVSQMQLNDNGTFAAAVLSPITAGDTPSEVWCWHVATGAIMSNQLATDVFFAAAGQILVTQNDQMPYSTLTCVDLVENRLLIQIPILFRDKSLANDGSTLLVGHGYAQPNALDRTSFRLSPSETNRALESVCRVYDLSTQTVLAELPAHVFVGSNLNDTRVFIAKWLNNGKAVAICGQNQFSTWRIWDLPIRKPTGWVVLTSLCVALVLYQVTRRTVRHKKQEP